MAAVITYLNPASVAGGTVAPTFSQSLLCNQVVAQVVLADADTTALLTHNFQVPTAQSLYLPKITQVVLGAGTNMDTSTWALTNSVAVTLTKATTAGSARTFLVYIDRPNTIVQ